MLHSNAPSEKTDVLIACLAGSIKHVCYSKAPGDVRTTAPLAKSPFFTVQMNSSTSLGSVLP